MSARAARKLKNEDDLSALQNQLKIENSEDEENIINDKDSVPNRFAFVSKYLKYLKKTLAQNFPLTV